MKSPLGILAACLVTALALPACVAEEGSEPVVEETSDELRSAALDAAFMKKYPQPAGMPKPWDQPDSTGWFDERGKCGPTAVANLLKLYKINVSPQEADTDGVNWIVGTRGTQIRDYLEDYHPQLGCKIEHPTDGPAFLRSKLASGQPVLVWYNTSGFMQSHWVTAVGTVGSGANELVIVMSWGRYYSIPMAKLDEAWSNVYGLRRPSIVCNQSTGLMR